MGAIYSQLSLQERRKIEDWWHAKVPVAEMARVLKRHKSTIYREINRNAFVDEKLPELNAYCGMIALRADDRHRWCGGPLPEAGPIEVKQTAMAINRLSARLRKSIASRMRVVAAAGHDLRTPLTRLRLRAEFIRDDTDREKWLADLAELEGIANSAIRLVREETGNEDRAEILLDAHLRGVVEDLRAAGHAVRLDIEAAPVVRAGPIALRRALSNLIINAATHGGGAEVHLSIRDGKAVIRVTDEGPGIPEALLGQVFEPFFSADPARRRTVPGAGLGLSITQSILERLDGTITIANRPRGGLEQRVELPLAPASA